MINRLKFLIMGRKKLQWFFDRLFRIGLRGMHYGNGAFVTRSGELCLIRKLSDLVGKKSSILVFDVGSNDGEYARNFIENYQGSFQMHCFEPSRVAFKRLKELLADRSNIILNNIGLGSELSEELLYFEKEGSTIASLYKLDHVGLYASLDLSEKVQIHTLDEYCKVNNVDEIDFLKIDVEGHEVGVLLGAAKMIDKGKVRAIQFEIGPGSHYSQAYLRRFIELLPDFKIYRVLQDGLQEIIYEEMYEIFLTTNYLALRHPSKK